MQTNAVNKIKHQLMNRNVVICEILRLVNVEESAIIWMLRFKRQTL